MVRFLLAILALTVAAVGSVLPAQQSTIAVAAAADLQAVMPQLIERFARDSGVQATASYGSSGNFFAQIQNGAPFDVFFSADVDYPKRLVASGHAEANSLYEYATGHLVVWTRADSGIDLRRGLAVVTDERVARVAIANPQYAPYGRAAVAALQHERLYEKVTGKLVLGENLSQTAQFAQTGNAQVGIISLSLALGPALKSGKYVEVPATFHPAIQQAAVVLSGSKSKTAARQLLDYLRRPQTAKLLQTFGFAPPSASR